VSSYLPNSIDDPSRWCEHAGFVRALAHRLVRNADVADDVAQEACLRALRGPGPAPGRFRAWIAAVVHNVVVSHRRRDRRQRLHEPQATPPAAGEDPHAAVLRLEAHEQLVAAVRALDEPYRTTIILRWFDGLSPRAIAGGCAALTRAGRRCS
jgi:RNA polymerase sigma factor (sigma-70 family)